MGSPGQGNQRFTVILRDLHVSRPSTSYSQGLLSSYRPFISSVSHRSSQVPTLIPLSKSPFPLLLLRSSVVSSIPWQVPLRPQWSKLHLRLSPKHISLSVGTEWSQLPETNQDSSAGTRRVLWFPEVQDLNKLSIYEARKKANNEQYTHTFWSFHLHGWPYIVLLRSWFIGLCVLREQHC